MLSSQRNASKENVNGVNVQVVVRCRPLNQKERGRCVQDVVTCTQSDVCVEDRAQSFKKYSFDRVFGPESSQEMVFDEAIKPFVENVLDGFNCTIFAYGQTGTGKTYTMCGNSTMPTVEGELPSDAGIIPRTVKRIFHKLQGSDSTVTVNFLELYNEELTDLLDPWSDQVDKDGNRKKKVMRIMEDGLTEPGMKLKKGVLLTPYPEDCVVTNETEILQILQKGSAQRQTAETLLNDKSSRSHSIFVISIHMKETKLTGEDVIKIGKLNLVDLAGSENVSRAGSNRKEERQRETGSINQSLLTLGRVINALVDKSVHVPYRDSNLTRLLRDSLGGSTKTLMIATINSGESSQEETFKTLDYAKRAKSIKNKPEVNQRISKTDLVKDLHAEIKRLKEELVCQRRKEGVIVLPLERHAQNEADRKNMLKEMDATRDHVKLLLKENEAVKEEVTSLESEKADLKSKLLSTEDQLVESTAKLQDQKYWSETYQRNCQELSCQLQTQSSNLESTMSSLRAHKTALECLAQRLDENASVSEEMRSLVKTRVDEACQLMDASLQECQTQTQALLLRCEAKKVKREQQAEALATKTQTALNLQDASQAEVSDLWSTSSESILEKIAACQKQYQDLQAGAEELLQSGFSQIKSVTAEQQASWTQTLRALQSQADERSVMAQKGQRDFMRSKRKLELLKKEAEAAEQQTIQKVQNTTAAILQETVMKCLQEAMPKILQTTAEALQPEKSAMTECTAIMKELDTVMSHLAQQQQLKIEDKEETMTSECITIHQELLEKLKSISEDSRVTMEANHVQAAKTLAATKDACASSQEGVRGSLAALQQELASALKKQRQGESSAAKDLKHVSGLTQTMAVDLSRQLSVLQQDFTARAADFNWSVGELPMENGTHATEPCSPNSFKSNAGSVESAKRVMTETHLENTPEPPTERIIRRAKRGRQAEARAPAKGPRNLN